MPARDAGAQRDAVDVLRRFRDGADPHQLHELRVFMRCLFVHTDAGFADCPPTLVGDFLEPAAGLPADGVRRRMFQRLAGIVPNPAFRVPEAARSAPLGRRALAREIARRAGPRRVRTTQAEAARAERRCVPYYSAIAEVQGPPHPDTSHYVPIVERAAAFLAGRPSPRVLDIACGFRLLLRDLEARVPGARCFGADLLPFGADVVSVHDRLPFKDASFDVVISTSLLDHLVDPASLPGEMARLVKPDGLVLTIATAMHVIHLTRDPWSYVEGLLSTAWPGILPPPPLFLEPLADVPMPWNFFHRNEMRALFDPHFERVQVSTLHYKHLRKFGLEGAASSLPMLKNFGGQLLTEARGPR